jgi:hypothetical protein
MLFYAAPGALSVIGKVANSTPPYGSDEPPHGAPRAAAEQQHDAGVHHRSLACLTIR